MNVLLVIYGIGALATAIGMAVHCVRRFGSEDVMDDISHGVFGLIAGVVWPLFAVGAVIALTARTLLGAVRSAR